MNDRFVFERTATLRAGARRPAGTKLKVLHKKLAQADRDRQRRLDLYVERASLGLPLFN